MSAIKRLDQKMRGVGDQAGARLAILDSKRRNKKLPDETVKGAYEVWKDRRGQQPFLPKAGVEFKNGGLRERQESHAASRRYSLEQSPGAFDHNACFPGSRTGRYEGRAVMTYDRALLISGLEGLLGHLTSASMASRM